MNFFVFLTTDNYQGYHRKREIEALRKHIDSTSGNVTCFQKPKSIFKLFSDSHVIKDPLITIRNLYTFIPMSLAYKHSLLMLIFVKFPIFIQVYIYAFCKLTKAKKIMIFYKPDQKMYLPDIESIYIHYDNYKNDDSYIFSKSKQYDSAFKQSVNESRVALFSSGKVLSELEGVNREDIFHYPNAISRDMIKERVFSRPVNDEFNIGFIGQLDDSFDSALLSFIATSFPRSTIHLLGPVSSREIQAVIDGNINITSYGFVQYENLSKYMDIFDIGICPYNSDEFNAYRNPLKVYEFFSQGLPVVCTPCDIETSIRHLVPITDQYQVFVNLIKSQVYENSQRLINERVSIARKSCWDDRITFMLSKL